MSTTASYCRGCGKALTEEEKANPGTIYCAICAPAAQASGPQPGASPQAPPPPPRPQTVVMQVAPPSSISPGLAFLLGLIPGVGAIYNAQYAKGLIHVVVFGLLISIANSDAINGDLGPLFGLMIPIFVVYMAFEAYHTAKRRLSGESVDEFSSIVPMRGASGFPVAPVLMIGVGVIFLLNNLDVLRIGQLLRYWPVFLIALGCYMLYLRLGGEERTAPPVNREEAPHEQ